MGALSRRLAVALLLCAQLLAVSAAEALGFSGFGVATAVATYGQQMTFRVALPDGAPDKLELLLRFAGSDSTVVAPVEPSSDEAQYVWDAAERHVTPNTRIDYQWRATDGGAVTLSREQTLLYDDDRTGLDWHSAVIGDATVHWYGSAEQTARRFGDLAAAGASPEQVAKITIFVVGLHPDHLPVIEAGRVAVFGDHKPADSLIGVERLARPDYLIEVEVIAVTDG